MAWYDGLFTSDSGLNDQDKAKLANSGLLQAGLGILAANGRPGTTPFQAIAGGLLGGLGSVQQGTQDIQNSRYKSAIEQSTLANMQRAQASAQQADKRQQDLSQAFKENTDNDGNVNYDAALRQYGKSHPEDYASAKQQIHGGSPKIQDTPQGAVAVYPDGSYEFLHPSDVGAVQAAAQTAQPMPASIPAPAGASGGGAVYTPPPPLLAAQQQVESGGNPNAVSSAGAIGTMQTLPSTLRDPGFGVMPAQNNTPAELTRVGNDYSTALQQKYGQTGGLAAYNWGPGNWQKALAANNGNVQAALASAPAETQNYVPKVLNAAGMPASAPAAASLPAGRILLGKPGSQGLSAGQRKIVDAQAAGIQLSDADKKQILTGIKSQDEQAQSTPVFDPNAPTGDSYIQQLPPERRAAVQAVLDGRLEPPKGFALKVPYWQGILQDAVQADPTFDASVYGARAAARKNLTSGKGADQIKSLNTLAGHLSTLNDALSNLDNSNVALVNRGENAWAGQFGGQRAKNLGAFQTAAKAVGDEAAKVFAGGSSALGDRNEIAHNLDPNMPVDKLKATLQTYAELVQSRLHAFQDQASSSLGYGAKSIPIVSPKAQATFNKLAGWSGDAPTTGNNSLDSIMSQYGSR